MTCSLDLVFGALSDATRRQILRLLLEDDMAVTDVAAPFGISLAAISKHLIVLERAGLIRRERQGRVIWCKLEVEALRQASVWITGFGLVEPLDLDGLERFLASEGLCVPEGEPEDEHDHDDEADEVDDAVQEDRPVR